MTVSTLRCERRVEPLGIDSERPLLAWTLDAPGRDRAQTAYQVRAGTSPGEADLWNGPKTRSSASDGILYAGKPIQSSERVFWRVRVWDEAGRVSPWSRTASWASGIMEPKDWLARWIGFPEPAAHERGAPESLLLRREFSVRPGLKSALLHVTGLGQYEMRLNGKKVGNDMLTPGWTNSKKTVLYDTYDVTALLRPRANAAGILLGNGMDNVHGPRYTKFESYRGRQCAFAQLKLVYRDGHTDILGTDEQWTAHAGPITFSSVFGGEDYDFRREPKRWDKSGFSDPWVHATVVEAPLGVLRGASSSAPPIRTFETLRPKKVTVVREGVETVDLGQNASLMIRLVASGPAGSRVRISPAELLKSDGTIDPASTRNGDAWWQITLAGSKVTYVPKFFYHGCRYLQIERFPSTEGEMPVVESVVGQVVHSAAPLVGQFSCSSALFNRIHKLIRWAQRSNLVSVITDCPHRERLGWLEQYHLNGPSLRYEHDLSTLFGKGAQDMEDSQLPNGLVPDIAPEFTVFGGPFRDSPEWGSAMVLVPWQQFLFHRDPSLLAKHYGAMTRYVDYLRTTAKAGIVSHGLGDWYDIGPGAPGPSKNTPTALTATAFFYEDLGVLAKAADILGKPDDASRYRAESESVKAAFNRAFFDSAKGYYATGSQTANAIPLVMGLVGPEERPGVLAQLVRDIQVRSNSVTAGDVGFRYVLRALSDAGRSDVVYAMNSGSERPGYGYQLKQGATSLTEAWDANPSSSQNHFMLGQIMEWFYHDLAGIQPRVGFKHFVIRPAVVTDLTWAKASYRSEFGLVESGWRRKGRATVFDLTVPPNSTATVELPGRPPFEVGSGKFQFETPQNPTGELG